jgi:outer membrane protein OmpA-like peptidoglycan-associated protein
MTINQDAQAYRRGVVFGFTVAEVVLLLVFCLLLLFMPLILSEAPNVGTPPGKPGVTARDTKSSALPKSDRPTTPFGTPDKPKSGGTETQRPLPPDWKVLVPDGAGREPTEGPNKTENAVPQPADTQPMPGLTLDALCKKLGIPGDKCLVVNADEALKSAGRHNWPPIIPLKDADGYHFLVGSAQPSSDFVTKLTNDIVPEILKYSDEFQTDVIEVVGHTDAQPIQGIVSNLDAMSWEVLLRGQPASKLSAADNAGLGLARAIAIVQVLAGDNRLKKFTILPSSSAQLIDTNGKLADGVSNGDVQQRRRIEIRLRQSEQAAPR